MWYGIFIALHAMAGVLAFVAGCQATMHRRWFTTYFWSLVGLMVFLILAIAVRWSEFDGAARLLFAAFTALGVFMVWRAWRAGRILASTRPDTTSEEVGERSTRYLAHVGFTLVALFDAFVVITVLDLGAAGWLVAVIGVAVAIAGHFAVVDMERRLTPTSAVTTA
jgi:hypothetical protein